MQVRGHDRPDRVGVGCAWGIKLETGETHRSMHPPLNQSPSKESRGGSLAIT